MSENIITVENLSKSYLVGHKTVQGYMTFRDVMAREARNFVYRAVDAFRGKEIVQGDKVEEFWALKNVSFAVKQGDAVGIIGRNGAGKSTLLKILSRITEPTNGRVTLRGRVASLLEVGTGFHPELTGRENIFLNGTILGMNWQEVRRKFDEIVAFAEIERFLDTPVKRYSSGMYMRLAFAVAAHLDPEILIVDEVLAVGDAEFQKKCLGRMDEISRREGRTVLCVSHNTSFISRLCPTAIWLDGGILRAEGPTADVMAAYLSRKSAVDQEVVDLSSHVRPSYIQNDRLRIQSLEWLCDLPLQHGQPLAARVRFFSTSPISALSIGIGFSNREGHRVVTYSTDLPDMNRPDVNVPGSYSVKLHLDSLPLQAEEYDLSIFARSGDSDILDNVIEATRMEITTGPTTPKFIDFKFAGARLPSKWSWTLTKKSKAPSQ